MINNNAINTTIDIYLSKTVIRVKALNLCIVCCREPELQAMNAISRQPEATAFNSHGLPTSQPASQATKQATSQPTEQKSSQHADADLSDVASTLEKNVEQSEQNVEQSEQNVEQSEQNGGEVAGVEDTVPPPPSYDEAVGDKRIYDKRI